LISIGILLLAASAFCPVAEAEELPRVAEAVAKLQAVTNRDPSVRSVAIDGHYSVGDEKVVFHYAYRAPNHFLGLQTFSSLSATFFAPEDDRVLSTTPLTARWPASPMSCRACIGQS
jgi:hypothetical protein